MKNKFIGLILILVVILSYPTWRYFHNANVFAKAIINHASRLGEWQYGSISTSLGGSITIRNLKFTPENYNQSYDISSIKIETTPLFLFKNSAMKLNTLLPEFISVSVNGASLDNHSSDIYDSLQEKSMWMYLAGYAGSFGCQKNSYTIFPEDSWKKLIGVDQTFNLDLFYSRQSNGSVDVDLILTADELFSSTWSSNLKVAYFENQLILEDLVVDKIFYTYLDNGFNLKRNNVCTENYNGSFAKYRLSSAEHLQQYLRTYYSKQLPEDMSQRYQRMLAPDIEFNAIITLNERKYVSDFVRQDQIDLYENSQLEISTSNSEFFTAYLVDIDYTKLDTERLKSEILEREKIERQIKLKEQKKTKSYLKAVVFKTGKSKSRAISIQKLSSVLNKKLRIKTKRGRPIICYLRQVNAKSITIDSLFKNGNAKMILNKKQIASVELMQ
jgi:hypothetical protein